MDLRQLGSTGLMVSPISLGLAALGRPGYINLGHSDDLQQNYEIAAMEAQAHAVLDAAHQAGIRYFDAARSYGRAEAFLASWLTSRNISVTEVAIGSKWGYTYTADWQVQAEKHEVKDHSLAVLQRQWQESQTHLGPYLNLYQVHSATLESGILENTEVLQALSRLKTEGLIIGLSVSGPQQAVVIETAIQIEIDGVRLFDCVQATWNLLETSSGKVLAAAHSMGVGVIIKEGVANGRLTNRNNNPEFTTKRHLLIQEAQRLNTTIDALALAAVIAQPWVDVVLSGAAQVEHLQANNRALEVAWDETAATALATLVEPAEVYWKTRGQLAWN